MPDRAVAVIVDEGRVLLVHRRKHGKEYYVLPGGGVEPGETVEEACVREVKEETGLDVTSLKPLTTFANVGRTEHYYLVQVRPGPVRLGGPEVQRQAAGNHYALEWVTLHRVPELNLFPEMARRLCRDVLELNTD
jgi:8-oxo-dGTP diphosphatase